MAVVVAPAGAAAASWAQPDDPDPPALLSPAPGAASADLPVLSWAPSANAAGYQVEVVHGDPNHPDAGLGCGGATVRLIFVVDCELPPGTYWWHVAATTKTFDTAHGWSSFRAFVKLAGGAGIPVILGPANGAILDLATGLDPLSWTPAPGFGYETELATDSAFAHVFSQGETGSEAPFVRPPTTVIGQAVFWRVRATTAKDGSTHGPWSAARSFTIRWTATPALVGPVDGSAHSTIFLQWQPISGATHYQIQVTDFPDTGFASAGGTTLDRTWIEWDGPWPSDHYRWRFRGLGPNGEATGWSAASTVVHDTSAAAMTQPAAPTLPAPTIMGPHDGATVSSLGETPLAWGPVVGSTGYQVQVLDSGTALTDPAPNDDLVAAPPSLWFANQHANTAYHWRARATGPDGLFGPWSSVRTFSTAPLPAPALTSPANGGAVTNDDLVLAWTGTLGASSTHVEWSQDPGLAGSKSRDVFFSPRAVPDAVLAPGTWYWRIEADQGGVLVPSPIQSFVVADHRGPAGRLFIGTSSYTDQPTVSVANEAEDAVGGVVDFRLSADGSTWQTYPWPTTVTWSLTDPDHGGSAPGRRDVYIEWRDDSGNWSDPVHAWVWYLVPPPADLNAPTEAAPNVVLGIGSIGPNVPLTIAWSATDLEGSAIASYDLEESVDGSAFAPIALASPTSTSISRLVPVGPSRRFRVRATDAAGNTSGWVYGDDVRVGVVQNNSTAIHYLGTWTTVHASSWFGGSARYSTKSRARATLAFSGRGIAFVSKLGPGRGKAWIYIDGTHVATVDLGSSRTSRSRVVFTRQWLAPGAHTIAVKDMSPTGRPRVDVDAFVVQP